MSLLIPPRMSIPTGGRSSLPSPTRSSLPTGIVRTSPLPARSPLASARPTTPESRAQAVSWLREWSRKHCGIAFSDEQSGVLEVRFESFCREVNLPSDAVQARIAAGDRALTLRLQDTVSTNYTFFFREPETFAFLRERMLPTFGALDSLRIWSAAASTGEEAYSIAILLKECMGADAARVRILGTDLSERTLKLAERGVYANTQLGSMSVERRARWFTSAPGNQYQVRDEVRNMCTFRRLNLLHSSWPFELRFHIVFLRNVLYYFEESVRRSILEACYEAVEPRGFLATSLTEPMVDLRTRWTQVGPAVFQRVSP